MTEKQNSPYENVVSNFPFHDFNEQAIFEGIYDSTVLIGDPEKKDKDGKPTTFHANVFYELSSGEAVHITNAYSINKAIEKARTDYEVEMKAGQMVFKIEFLGKTEIKGKPFNQFNIGICTLQQYEAFKEAPETNETKLKAKK